ncbi:hypothetical protein LTR17_004729 [Elasticomyces elasticus]|nr:hypothetical protein LTR17_004729 [Elasticomyces elasticus]
MRPSDDLIKSGLLYEGNFDAWREQIICTLHVYGFKVEKMSMPGFEIENSNDCWTDLPERANRLVLNRISPAHAARLQLPCTGLRPLPVIGHGGGIAPAIVKLVAEYVEPEQATKGRLSRSGLLYEGNFSQWKQETMCAVEVYKQSPTPTHYNQPPLDAQTSRLRIFEIILDRVSPALAKRVSVGELDGPEAVIRNLEAIAKPFRLNNLPVELRDPVYKFYFEEGMIFPVYCRTAKHHKLSKPTIPNLLLVSRSINTEALPVCYASVDYRFEFQDSYLMRYLKGGDSVAVRMMRRWARDKVQDNVKYLRQLSVGCERYDGIFTVRFEPKKGLTVSCPPGSPEEVKVEWETHITESEAKRQELGSVGEAIVAAVTSMLELWH